MSDRSGVGPLILNVGLTVLAVIFSGTVLFGFNLIVARVYGPDALGEVSVALGLALFLGQMTGTLGTAATKFVADALGRGDEDSARQAVQFLFTVNLAIGLLLAVGLAVATPWAAPLFHLSTKSALIAAAMVPVYGSYLLLKSVYYGLLQVRAYARNEIVSDLAFFVLLGAVLLLHASPWLLLPFVLNNAIFVVIALRDLRPYLKPFNWGRFAPRGAILRYSALAGGGTVASLGRSSLGTTTAGLFLSHHAVGLYAAASTLAAPLPLAPRALSLVIFATMAGLHGAGDASSVRRLFRESTDWLVVALGLPCGLLIINAGPVIGILFRREYAAAAVATQIVVLGTYLNLVCLPSIDALTSTKYVQIPTVTSVIGLMVSAALWVLLIPSSGIKGAAIGFAVGSALSGFVPAFFAHRLIGSASGPFLRIAAVLTALLMAIVLVRGNPLVSSIVFVGAVVILYARKTVALLSLMGRTYRARKRLRDRVPERI